MTASPAEVLARVNDELRAMWSSQDGDGGPSKSRACTMNLVVVAPSPDRAASYVPVVDEVVLHVPARAIVVGLDPDGNDGLDASATAVCTSGDGGKTVVCSERITMMARGRVSTRLSSCVDTVCATDVPTTLVWLARVHADDPSFALLARDADRIVLDANESSLASLSHVLRWARRRPAAERPGFADLAWTRLASWQELCARMFDPQSLRALAHHVTRVSLVQTRADRGLAPEGALLLGWLATRLGWKPASLAGKLRVVRQDGGYVQVQVKDAQGGLAPDGAVEPTGTLMGVDLEAISSDATMRGTIVRGTGVRETGKAADTATWRVEVTTRGETQRLEQHTFLRMSDPAQVLARTLHRPGRDEALVEAVRWADELRGEELASG